MLLRLQKFHLEVTYKKGTEMVLADTLSRAYKVPQRGEPAAEATRGETEKDEESINTTQYISMSEETQTRMQRATEEDEDLRDLKTVIRHGWPLRKEDLPIKVRDYFPFRDELTLQNGLILKGERLVVPTLLREEMTEKLHSSHIGIQGCLRRARETLHWPGMNKKVEDYIARCSTCNSYQSEQAKEPMISQHIPTRPWEKVGMDLFELNNRDFLITVDYYSNYFEVDRLTSKTAKEVINKTKANFVRHGILDQVFSVNGQPFSSSDFENFAAVYGFEYNTSSPNYPQSNGKVENAVKTAKNLMKKAMDSQSAPYLALLAWRNTPSESVNSSPAQTIFGRRTKSRIPTSTATRRSRAEVTEEQSQTELLLCQRLKGAERLPTRYVVRIQPPRGIGRRKPWTKARVGEKVDVRSYEARTEDGRVLRRNRRHLRLMKEVNTPDNEAVVPNQTSQASTTTIVQQPPPAAAVAAAAATPQPHQEVRSGQTQNQVFYVTRSGRVVKPLVRFK